MYVDRSLYDLVQADFVTHQCARLDNLHLDICHYNDVHDCTMYVV